MATLNRHPAIGYVNRASGRTITVTGATAGYPGSSLNDPRLSTTWRSAAAAITAQNVSVDLGSSLDIDVVALLGFNGEDDATYSPVTSEASDFSTQEYNPGSQSAFDVTHTPLLDDTPPWGRHLIDLPGQTYNSRYARLTLNDAGNPDNHLKGSVLWVGPLWQFPNGMSVESTMEEPQLGSPGLEIALREWSVVAKALNDAESRELLSVMRNKLRSGRYLFIPHPTRPELFVNEAIYCTVVEYGRTMQPYAAASGGVQPYCWDFTIVFREVID